jgi:hypothetical protein
MSKQEEIKLRARKHALLFIERNADIRSVSKITGYSRSTIHLDLHRIEEYYPDLYNKVLEKINFHQSVKHLRGGYATQEKRRKKDKK